MVDKQEIRCPSGSKALTVFSDAAEFQAVPISASRGTALNRKGDQHRPAALVRRVTVPPQKFLPAFLCCDVDVPLPPSRRFSAVNLANERVCAPKTPATSNGQRRTDTAPILSPSHLQHLPDGQLLPEKHITMARINPPHVASGPTLLGVPMKQASLITVRTRETHPGLWDRRNC